MHISIKSPQKSAVLVTVLLGGVIFTSCASSVQPSLNQPLPSRDNLANQAPAPIISEISAQQPQPAPVERPRSQLIKKAAMTVIVDSVGESIESVSRIINQQQGDLIALNERQPTGDNRRHTASITLRVPQNFLEVTLKNLAKLGTVSHRHITAEDVGDRLVDFQARLNNLRRTEANLQKIMDRSGSIKDVLNVSQELSNIRQSIEQIDAQLKNLQNQVAYSTITLNLEAAVSSSSPQPGIASQIQGTWNNSTNSLATLMMTVLKLGIWSMVYSPILLVMAAGIYSFMGWRRTRGPLLAETLKSTSVD
ncbi:DUF4349 domain-containing protein [Umezakia ovalisporum]|jgi:hypothetical protein|uniref:DUF4349 domain-containing protein n=2 Tax=Umezakia ovalisporum TaxID=75695 RepID=A0AA43H1B7_9CYAN|nr:DUF4349 domain-containing protein [Umezakia ovalisporum]MBI1241913.1 DUF4349 domain-containing protein [Nostoc sp. RI_552]MDH6058546.1 DUF4349 domain-containing protein [Umezakia ovalisporum FSS-43]MDH6064968.1 DUF4349 domain-containing protein [Umezakia ovalisporum FSS-62]MDH6067600.1 DUF4349 domain-containing protein [Umezakia ovalisporum APH033B]MDH6069469.1 DUF4349 domain-containing protein [Umezakia ovalisporum CobakiLakeA]